MSAVIVLPSIVPEQTRACLATFVNPPLPEPPTHQQEVVLQHIQGTDWHDGQPENQLVIVWNTVEHNLGVGQSWEIGRQEVLRVEADWLWIVSAGVRFGPEGGRDFLRALDQAKGSTFTPAPGAPERPVLAVEGGNGLGWHCLAMSREMLETVGRFDPIYEVAYYEDVDYSWRFQCACGLTPKDYPLWPKVDVDCELVEVAHGIKHGGVHVDMAANEQRFLAKWGGPSGSEAWCHPYNDAVLDHAFVGPQA